MLSGVGRGQWPLGMAASRSCWSWADRTSACGGYASQPPSFELRCVEESSLVPHGGVSDGVDRVDLLFSAPHLTFIVKRCRKLKNLSYAHSLHAHIRNNGLETHATVGNHSVPMFIDCGSVGQGQHLFDRLIHRNEHSWTSLILGYIQSGKPQHAFHLYQKMQEDEVDPSRYTLMALLKACATMKDVARGQDVHAEIAQRGLGTNVFVGSTLVDMYAKCGSLAEAQEIFDRLPFRNVVSWNALIYGYAEHGSHQEALKCFEQMQAEGVSPNSVTFASILKACGNAGAIDKGRKIQLEIKQKGFERDLFVYNTLIDMYAKCGSLSEAHQVLNTQSSRDVVSWNALLSGYASHGFMPRALKCFEHLQLDGILPDIVSWTTLIAGYAEHGPAQEALECFKQMQFMGIAPNTVTFICSLKACGNIGAIEEGKDIHRMIAERGLEKDPFVGNTLVDMYAKCGSVLQAREVFNKLLVRDIVTWNSMMNGYAINHEVNMAIQCFLDMQELSVKPNSITFTCLLTVCSRASLVSKGREYFKVMREEYGIVPTVDHYTCIVDLLARSGYLRDADEFLECLPCTPTIESWGALLSACKAYGDEKIGMKCFKQILQMNPEDAASYVFMANIYTSSGRKDEAYRLEELRKHAGAKKIPASAFIEVNNKVHEFVVGNNRSEEISAMLYCLNSRVMEEGHAPNLEAILGNVSDDEKELAVCQHAEKLALAFGLLNTLPGKSLHVTKNLRMCHNCHNVHKVISRIEMREIVLRDSYCVHHFKDGLCSCGVDF